MSIATRFAFGEELIKIAGQRDDFVVCSADTKAVGLENFGRLFPGREFSIGIAEQNLMATAAGLASCNNKVYTSTFAVFASMRACEQVRTFICYPNLNVTILATHTGLQVGDDGATHSAIEDVSIMRAFPNMTIVQPADAVAARQIARASVDFKGPLYVRLHRNPADDIYNDANYRFKVGRANLAADTGDDLTIVVSGILLSKALQAARILKKQEIGVKILDMSTIKPLDKEALLRCASSTKAVITIEDHTILGGLGSAVAEVLGENCPRWLKRIGVEDQFGSSGEAEQLYVENHMSIDDIVAAAHQLSVRG